MLSGGADDLFDFHSFFIILLLRSSGRDGDDCLKFLVDDIGDVIALEEDAAFSFSICFSANARTLFWISSPIIILWIVLGSSCSRVSSKRNRKTSISLRSGMTGSLARLICEGRSKPLDIFQEVDYHEKANNGCRCEGRRATARRVKTVLKAQSCEGHYVQVNPTDRHSKYCQNSGHRALLYCLFTFEPWLPYLFRTKIALAINSVSERHRRHDSTSLSLNFGTLNTFSSNLPWLLFLLWGSSLFST